MLRKESIAFPAVIPQRPGVGGCPLCLKGWFPAKRPSTFLDKETWILWPPRSLMQVEMSHGQGYHLDSSFTEHHRTGKQFVLKKHATENDLDFNSEEILECLPAQGLLWCHLGPGSYFTDSRPRVSSSVSSQIFCLKF